MKKVVSILLVLLSVTAMGQSPYRVIRSNMNKLKGMIGTWEVETKMISKDGKVLEEKGVYEIKWALDSTYILLEADLRMKSPDKSRRKFVCWTTFDSGKQSYRNMYLYGGTSMCVEETGKFDDHAKKLHTNTVLILPDGRTEFLRTELDMEDSDLMVFNSWSRFGDEREFNDFHATIRRTEGVR